MSDLWTTVEKCKKQSEVMQTGVYLWLLGVPSRVPELTSRTIWHGLVKVKWANQDQGWHRRVTATFKDTTKEIGLNTQQRNTHKFLLPPSSITSMPPIGQTLLEVSGQRILGNVVCRGLWPPVILTHHRTGPQILDFRTYSHVSVRSLLCDSNHFAMVHLKLPPSSRRSAQFFQTFSVQFNFE